MHQARSNSRTGLIAELLDGHAAQGKLVSLAEILEPLNGRLPLIPGRFHGCLSGLPHGHSLRNHLFGRAVLTRADGILDDAFNPGGRRTVTTNLLTPRLSVAERAGAVKRAVAAFILCNLRNPPRRAAPWVTFRPSDPVPRPRAFRARRSVEQFHVGHSLKSRGY